MAEWGQILVVVAHADDAELSAGGSVAKWVSEGNCVDYVVATNGNKGTKDLELSPHRLAEIREAEQRAAAEVLGVRDINFLLYNDGELHSGGTLGVQLAILIRHYRPGLIVTHDPWRPYMVHPDHRTLGYAVIEGIVAARDHLFLPALSVIDLKPHHTPTAFFAHPGEPNCFVDITETLPKKIEALSRHVSQMGRLEDWPDWIRDWAGEIGRKGGHTYAEGFHKMEMT